MFSQSIIDANIARVTDRMRVGGRTNFRLVRMPYDVIEEMCEHLEKLRDPKTNTFTRTLSKEESAFIENEMIMCQLDFRYACENYFRIQLAPIDAQPEGWSDLTDIEKTRSGSSTGSGSVGRFLLNAMQVTMLAKLAQLEELCYEQQARGAAVNGILLIIAKARQLGASTFFQALGNHRLEFYSGLNGLTAAIDQGGTESLHRRFERTHNELPFWLRATPKFWPKDQGVTFENGSVMELQNGTQKKDLGKGETWHYFHVTECAVFDRPEDHFDEGLFPAVPTGFVGGIPVLGGMESTAKGKLGWWYDFVTQVMTGTAEGGMGRFSFYFAPFYLIDIAEEERGQRSKYRLEPPVGWEPAPTTVLMANKAYDTSPEYTLGARNVRLSREVLYWYELTRLQYYKKGRLNIFLQSYPVTPEESFQHTSAGAFSNETIERMDLNCSKYDPWPYRLATAEELPAADEIIDVARPVYHVANHHLVPMRPEELDRDPRGIVFLWEAPSASFTYVLGGDPTGGIPGWNRAFRRHDDVKTDNGAIEVFRKGGTSQRCEDCSGLGWRPTENAQVKIECFACDGRGRKGGRAVQVAEFAAPIDPEDYALYVFLLGRLFVGNSDLEECLAVIENNNTGLVTIRTLLNKYNYSNLWQSRTLSATASPKFAGGYGFTSGPASVPVLHARSRIYIVRRDIEIRSRALVRECSDAIVKITGEGGEGAALVTRERFYVPPGGGRHDDRMTALFLAIWGLFPFEDMGEDGTSSESTLRDLPPLRDFARTDATSEMQKDQWNQAADRLLANFDLNFGHHEDCALNCSADHDAETDADYVLENDEGYDDDY